jgi:hypothetical protein
MIEMGDGAYDQRGTGGSPWEGEHTIARHDPWREADLAAQRARPSDEHQARLDELDAIASRTDAEEIEYLALSWFTDHADRDRAWEWALAAARTLRPVNYAMNVQLNEAKKTDPLESRVDPVSHQSQELRVPGVPTTKKGALPSRVRTRDR